MSKVSPGETRGWDLGVIMMEGLVWDMAHNHSKLESSEDPENNPLLCSLSSGWVEPKMEKQIFERDDNFPGD